MFCVSSGASAYDFEADGIYYNIMSEAGKTVEVTSGKNEYVGEVSIPETVENEGIIYTITAIGGDAFDDCSSLTSVNIPDGVVSIGNYAFSDCSSLESVTLGSGVGTIGDNAFMGCSSLTEITCRATVPPVCGERCFADIDISNCTLSVPEGAEEAYKTDDAWKEFLYEYFISGGIRYGALTSSQGNIATVVAGGEYTGDITIPATVENGGTTYTVTKIGEDAFFGCSSLVSVDIPDGVVSIGDYAFYACRGLESVTLGSGLETIGESAFNNCSNLVEINSLATLPPVCIINGIIGSYCFDGVDKNACMLNVPEGAAGDYRASDGRTEIPAQAGKLYIVRCGNAAYKTAM